jgi:hypothetical protein
MGGGGGGLSNNSSTLQAYREYMIHNSPYSQSLTQPEKPKENKSPQPISFSAVDSGGSS